MSKSNDTNIGKLTSNFQYLNETIIEADQPPVNMEIDYESKSNELLTVVDKFKLLFPGCRVWEVAYNEEVKTYGFYVSPLENDYLFKFPKQVRAMAVDFKGGYLTTVIDDENFTKQEQKELLKLAVSELRDLSHKAMKQLLIESFSPKNASSKS